VSTQQEAESGTEAKIIPADVVAAPSKAEKAQPVQVSLGTCVMVSIMINLMVGGLMLVAYDHWVAQKIVTVDAKGFYDQTQQDYLAGKLTDDQLKAAFVYLKEQIDAIPKHRTVVMGDAVINGVEKIPLKPFVPEAQVNVAPPQANTPQTPINAPQVPINVPQNPIQK
jgi:hypothetical protein